MRVTACLAVIRRRNFGPQVEELWPSSGHPATGASAMTLYAIAVSRPGLR